MSDEFGPYTIQEGSYAGQIGKVVMIYYDFFHEGNKQQRTDMLCVQMPDGVVLRVLREVRREAV